MCAADRRTTHGLVFLLVLLGVLLLGLQPALAGSNGTSTYPVTGSDIDEVRDSMAAGAAAAGIDGGRSGQVNANPQWNGNLTSGTPKKSGSNWEATASVTYCTFTGSVDTTTILPSWTPPPDCDQDLIDEWNRFLAALRKHEAGHVSKFEALEGRIRGLKAQVEGMETTGTGATGAAAAQDALDKLANKIQRMVDQLVDLAVELNATYDDETDHGREQGAVLTYEETEEETFDDLIDRIRQEMSNCTVESVRADDGGRIDSGTGCSLDVPAGAVPEDVAIALSASEIGPELPAGLVPRSPVYRFTPSGLHFDAPALLTMSVSAAADPRRIAVYSHSPGDKGWVEVPPLDREVEPAPGVGYRLEVKVTHFTEFVVVEPQTYDESPPAYGRSAWRYKDLHDSSPKYEGAYAQF
ncbi:MAG: DUF922 domain-containing protein, partial [Actinobacteria bacterium]